MVVTVSTGEKIVNIGQAAVRFIRFLLPASGPEIELTTLIDARILLEAKRLLVFTTRSVADIGSELGFDDPSNFSSFFRQSAGTTPKAFRSGAL